jgi:hypothetical protein
VARSGSPAWLLVALPTTSHRKEARMIGNVTKNDTNKQDMKRGSLLLVCSQETDATVVPTFMFENG